MIEILSDDYDTDEKSVELKTKTENGVTYTTKGVLSGKDNAMNGSLSVKYLVSGMSMTSKLTTGGVFSQEAVLEKTGVKGLKVTALGALGPKQSFELTGEYVIPHVAAVLKANCIGQASLSPSMTLGLHGVTVGAQAKMDIATKKFSGVNAVLNYCSKANDHEATLHVMGLNTADKTAKFTFSRVISPDYSVAAEFDYSGGDEKLMTVGTKYAVDSETCLKAKVNTKGMLWCSYAQQIRKNTTLTLCSEMNLKKLDQPTQKFGIALAIE